MIFLGGCWYGLLIACVCKEINNNCVVLPFGAKVSLFHREKYFITNHISMSTTIIHVFPHWLARCEKEAGTLHQEENPECVT